MVILARELSNKCEKLVASVLRTLPITVYFRDIREIGRSTYGCTDFSHYNEGYCNIYLNLEQSPIQFEVTLLHELHHVEQVGKGYPYVMNKIKGNTFQENPTFYEKIGSQIQSAILDLDVITYLEIQGLSSSIFSDFGQEDDLSFVWKNVTDQTLEDPSNLTEAVLHLYVGYVRAGENGKIAILNSVQQFPRIIKAFEAMQEAIEIEKCCDPLYCAYAMGWIIDHFSLWKNYYIDFRGERIRTHGEYLKYFDKT